MATIEIETKAAIKTADGLNFEDLKTVYFLNKFSDKIEEFQSLKELCIKRGKVIRKDGEDFDPFSDYLYPSDFFGSQSAAIDALKTYVTEMIAHHIEQIKFSEKRLLSLRSSLANLEQDTVLYAKPSSEAKSEKVGNIRI